MEDKYSILKSLLLHNSLKFLVIQGILALIFAALTNGASAAISFILLIGMGLSHYAGSLSAAKLILENYELKDQDLED